MHVTRLQRGPSCPPPAPPPPPLCSELHSPYLANWTVAISPGSGPPEGLPLMAKLLRIIVSPPPPPLRLWRLVLRAAGRSLSVMPPVVFEQKSAASHLDALVRFAGLASFCRLLMFEAMSAIVRRARTGVQTPDCLRTCARLIWISSHKVSISAVKTPEKKLGRLSFFPELLWSES